MNRYKIIAFKLDKDNYRIGKPLAYLVELPTLQDAMNHADTVGEATKREAISIYSVSKEIPQIKGMLEWIPAARRVTPFFWMLSKQPTHTKTIKEE